MEESIESGPSLLPRRITGEDLEKYKDIRRRSIEDSPQAFGDSLTETLQRPDATWLNWINNSYIYVIENNGHFVASATLRKDEHGVWVINAVWTDPTFRKQGLSKKILEQILLEAKKENIDTIELEVNPSQAEAMVLYESLKFTNEGTRADQIMGDGKLHTTNVMRIHLNEKQE